MSWTKRQIILQAFEELGLASYAFDLSADELESAMVKLDNMMAVWTTNGIVFDPVYPNPVNIGEGSLDDETNAPQDANSPMYCNLALAIAPSFGKTPPAPVMKSAAYGYSLLAQNVEVPTIRMTGMIKGAGAKDPTRPFIAAESET